MMSVPPSLYHHHPKQEREEVEAIVSRHSLQFRSQGGDVGGCFHGGSSSAAGNWPDGTFGGGIADNGSIRPAHTRRRKPRDLIIVYCGRPALLPDRTWGRHRSAPFYPVHGGVSPAVTASARANFPPRFARARRLFRRKPGVVSGGESRPAQAPMVRRQVWALVGDGLQPCDAGDCRTSRSNARPHHRLFQPADEPFEILVKPAPAHTHLRIRRRLPAPAKMSGWAATGSRSSLVFVENKPRDFQWTKNAPREDYR